MKRVMILLLGIIASLVIRAQSSDFFNYQAIIRDAGGNAKANTSVSIFVEILQGSISGTVSFSETHSKTTNSVGLVNLQIGSINSTEFSTIDWSNTPFFIRISRDCSRCRLPRSSTRQSLRFHSIILRISTSQGFPKDGM